MSTIDKRQLAAIALDAAVCAIEDAYGDESTVEVTVAGPLERMIRVRHRTQGTPRYFVVKLSEPI